MPITVPCPPLDVVSRDLCVRLPGGTEVCVQIPQVNPSNFQVAVQLVGQLNSALTPLVPIFNIIDAIIALKNCTEALPDALGPPPDPSAIAECIPELLEKVEALLALVPQLSVPLMIVDSVDALIAVLNGIVDQLERVVVQEARIAAAATKATEPGNEALVGMVDCANTINTATKANLGEATAPLNRLIGVLNIFLGLIGLPEIPALDDLPEDSQEAIDALRSVVTLLENLRDSIPLP